MEADFNSVFNFPARNDVRRDEEGNPGNDDEHSGW